MAFTPKRFSNILQRMIDRVVARSRLTDTEIGGAVHTTLSAVARELDDGYFQMSQLRDSWDIDKAYGSELDLRALDLPDGGLLRGETVKATTTLVFGRTGTSGTVTIPAGTVAQVPNGGPSFVTTASGQITDTNSTSASIPARAQVAGADGNVAINAITQLRGVAGVETVTNNTVGIAGSDRESDERFRSRIRSYLRALSRGTETSIVYAALNVDLTDAGFGRVGSVGVIPYPDLQPGIVNIYIDDGNGTAGVTEANYGAPEAVLTNAAGGERRLYLASVPVVDSSVITIELNGTPLTRNVDFRLDPTTGLIIFDSAVYPTGLTTGDDVTAEYTWYVGLIAEVQKVVNGDPTDRGTYPGYKAAGIQAFVLPPFVTQLAVEGVVTPEPGFAGSVLRDSVATALIRYVNSRGVGEDAIYTELIAAAQSVAGVRDIVFSTPVTNVTVGEDELIRLASGNIDLT